ncbi:MAG TPA: OsmC family protein [Tepidisphaeraceae bacterium]|jgi:organic hydroperoxide reductase OsmC/OhrA
MSEHIATIEWQRDGALFTDRKYSRGHRWKFDGGVEVPASSSPHAVKLPLSVAEAVDPEEAFIASLSSCHMLWFLDIACRRGFVIDSYRDEAVGVLAKNSEGKFAITRVTLRPKVIFSGDKQPSSEDLAAMHQKAHEECFIANSVKTEVVCEPVT